MKPRHALLIPAAAAMAVLLRSVDAGALLQATLVRVHGLGFWAPAAFVAAYILACVLFMPGAVLAVGSGAHARTPVEWGLYGAGLLATAAVSVYVTRIARGALEEETRT